ncbi:MAG: class I SAM-dependent methyltransferase [Eubacteriales bacterium]|nr:class I SAM-dependent methyltransferase [Eubacteriales bacterium]
MTDIEQNWDRMAEAYEQFTSGNESYSYRIEWPCIQQLLPDISGKSVVDLGCGTGRFTFWLEEKNPRTIIGVDLSDDMLRLAKAKAKALGSNAAFYKDDIARYHAEETFDLVFSSTTSHYIRDLDALFTNIYSLLKPGGTCILSAMNPVYTAQYPVWDGGDTFPDDDAWTVRYMDRRERSYIQPWIEYNPSLDNFLSRSYQHTFSDYINAILRAKLTLLEAREPLPPEEWKEKYPERYEGFIETPSYLVLKMRKNG